jgi:hypothetical protein
VAIELIKFEAEKRCFSRKIENLGYGDKNLEKYESLIKAIKDI